MEEVALESGPYRTAGLKDAGDTSKRLTADILTLSPGTRLPLCLPRMNLHSVYPAFIQSPDRGGHGLPFSSPAQEASLTQGSDNCPGPERLLTPCT